MNDTLSSFIIGFLCTAALFFLCLVFVIGIKSVYLSIKKYINDKFSKSPPSIPEPIKKAVKKRKKKPSATPVRSIEIDPDTIDRIYVKKIS